MTRRTRSARTAAVLVAIWGALAAPTAAAQDGEAADPVAAPADAAAPGDEAAVKAAFDHLRAAQAKYVEVRKLAQRDESKMSVVEVMGQAVRSAEMRFLNTFVNSDWETWAKGRKDEWVLLGLVRTAEALFHSDEFAQSRTAFRMVLDNAPGTPFAEEAALFIPFTISNESEDLEAVLAEARALFDAYSPAGQVEMRAFEGNLLVALERMDEAIAAYKEAVALADAIPPEDQHDHRRGLRIKQEIETRLAMIGSSAPGIQPLAWVGRDAGKDTPNEITFEPGHHTVVILGSAECRNCARHLRRFDREKEARAEQDFDVIGLRTYSRNAFLPNGPTTPRDGQDVYGLSERDFVEKYVSALHKVLELDYPLAVVSPEQARLVGTDEARHFGLLVVGPWGDVIYASTTENTMGVVFDMLRQRMGAVEYPEVETRGTEEPTVTDVSTLTADVTLTERDSAPLPEGPQFAEEFLATEAAYRATPSDREAAIAYAKALSAFERYRDAAEALAPALEKAPDDIDLIVQQARSLLQRAERTSRNSWQPGLARVQREAAGACIERALAIDPSSVSALALKVSWILDDPDQDPVAAKRIADQLVKDHPDSAVAHNALAIFWFRMAAIDLKDLDVWQKLESTCKAVVRLDTEGTRAPKAWLLYGLARKWQGATDDELIDAFVNAAVSESHRSNAVAQIANRDIVRDDGKRTKALLDLEEAYPGSAAIQRALAIQVFVAGDREGAIQSLTAAVEASPTDPHIRMARGYLRVVGGFQIDEGVDDLCDAVRLCRGTLDRRVYDFVDLQATRALTLSAKQRDRLWSLLFHEFPKEINAPGNAEIWFRDTRGDYVKSYVWCLRGLAADPHDPMTHNDIGIMCEERKSPIFDTARAAEAYKAAIAAAKHKGIADSTKSLGYKNAVNNLMKLLMREGKAADLRAYADAELRDDPRYDEIVLMTGEATGE